MILLSLALVVATATTLAWGVFASSDPLIWVSLGAGLGRLKGRVFRIGHLGDFNELMLCGTLCGVEMGLALAGVPFQRGGVNAAMTALCEPVSVP